jgi:hypothetical protein
MNSIEIISTTNTPSVKFYPDRGFLEIKGRSISENSATFYRPLLNSVERYIFKPVSPTLVHIQFDYFNTASAKCIIELLKRMESLPQKNIKVEVNWYYKRDEPTMYQAGMDYKTILNLDFKMVRV